MTQVNKDIYETFIKPVITEEFERWWLGFYGPPENYVYEHEPEYMTDDAMNEYYIRKTFAWHGWSAIKES